MTDPTKLARALAVAAEYLDSTGNPVAGIVRQGARHIAALPAPPPSDACQLCGCAVVQPDRGRRRVYCSARCRNRAAKRARNASVST